MNKIAKLLLLLSLTIGGTTTAYAQQVFKIASLAPQGSDWIVRIEKGAKQITKESFSHRELLLFPLSKITHLELRHQKSDCG